MKANSSQETSQLVMSCRTGETQAFACLFQRYYGPALAYAKSVVRSHETAQDIVQDAFLTAFRDLHKLQQPERFFAWVKGIVFNGCRRIFRARDMAGLPEQLADIQSDPAKHFESNEQKQRLYNWIGRLPDLERQVIELFYLCDCSQRDIAAFLNIPLTTVNARLYHGRQRLKRGRDMPAKSPELKHCVGTVTLAEPPYYTVQFPAELQLDIFDGLTINNNGQMTEVLKVIQRRPDNTCRCLSVKNAAIDLIKVGARVVNTQQLAMPPLDSSSKATLSEIKAIDEHALHEYLQPKHTPCDPLETGIKAIELFSPLNRGDTVIQTGIPGCGRLVLVEELIQRLPTDANLTVLCLVDQSDPRSIRGMIEPGVDYTGEISQAAKIEWILVPNANDPEQQLRSLSLPGIHCSPIMAIQGLYPAIDPARSEPAMVDQAKTDSRHESIANRARKSLMQLKQACCDPELLELLAVRATAAAAKRARKTPELWLEKHNESLQLELKRARRLAFYLTQPFQVAEQLTGVKATSVARSQVIEDVESILNGEADQIAEAYFLYGGDLNEIRARHDNDGPIHNVFRTAVL